MSGGAKQGLLAGIAGFLAGASIGYFYRPPAFLVGQLPFRTVISRGADLKGFDQLLIPAARSSFNYVLFGGILGAALAVLAGRLLLKGGPKRRG